MGWASGSGLFGEIIDAVKPVVKAKKARVKLYKKLISAFEDHDWDSQQECEGEDPAYDQALRELHPDWFEEDEDDEP